MIRFADWLRYYNDLDMVPMLEALAKMRAFYNERGVDILKDAVSLPGVVLQYLLRGTEEVLYAPKKEAYTLLKEAKVGGPSIVFTRYHEAGVTRIRSHKYGRAAKLCRRIQGYDANALYLSTMSAEMPFRKEKVTIYKTPEGQCVGAE